MNSKFAVACTLISVQSLHVGFVAQVTNIAPDLDSAITQDVLSREQNLTQDGKCTLRCWTLQQHKQKGAIAILKGDDYLLLMIIICPQHVGA